MLRKTSLLTAILAASLLCTTANIYAHPHWDDYKRARAERQHDIYLGIQGGYAKSDIEDLKKVFAQIPTFSSKFKEARYIGRIYGQWELNHYLATEMGLTYIDNETWSVTKGPTTVDDKIVRSIVDLTLNLRAPFQNGFDGFLKFGIAYHMIKNSITFDETTATVRGRDRTHTGITFGGGLTYAFSDRVRGDLTWQFFRGNDSIGDFVSDTNVWMAGIAYHLPT